MKTLATTILAMGLFAATANAGIITNSASAPTVTTGDIANLVAPTGNQNFWSDRAVVGNTFQTPSQGGWLHAVTFQLNEDANGPIQLWQDYRLRIGSVVPGAPDTINAVFEEVTRNDEFDDIPNDTYVTYTLDAPLLLPANEAWAFDLALTRSGHGWQSGITNIRFSGDSYAGGDYYSPGNLHQVTALTENNINRNTGRDMIFHLDITEVPEPASMALFGLGGLMLLKRRRA
jgi:hypothetical protein